MSSWAGGQEPWVSDPILHTQECLPWGPWLLAREWDSSEAKSRWGKKLHRARQDQRGGSWREVLRTDDISEQVA